MENKVLLVIFHCNFTNNRWINRLMKASMYVYIFWCFGYTYASDLSWSLSDIFQFYICLFNLICFVWVTFNSKNYWPSSDVVYMLKLCIFKKTSCCTISFVTHFDIYLRPSLFHVWFYNFCTLLTNHYESLLTSQLTLLDLSVKSQNCFMLICTMLLPILK